jgi:hypothetical protein
LCLTWYSLRMHWSRWAFPRLAWSRSRGRWAPTRPHSRANWPGGCSRARGPECSPKKNFCVVLSLYGRKTSCGQCCADWMPRWHLREDFWEETRFWWYLCRHPSGTWCCSATLTGCQSTAGWVLSGPRHGHQALISSNEDTTTWSFRFSLLYFWELRNNTNTNNVCNSWLSISSSTNWSKLGTSIWTFCARLF